MTFRHIITKTMDIYSNSNSFKNKKLRKYLGINILVKEIINGTPGTS